MITCIHHNDADGRCSAAIVKRALWPVEVNFYETDYKDPAPQGALLVGQDVIIVDFSYKSDAMQHIIDTAHSVVWIDHHATAKDYPYQELAGMRNFADKAMAGCELTWKYYFPMLVRPTVVKLIGDYDKWALLMPSSKIFYEGLKLYNTEPTVILWEKLLAEDLFLLQEITQAGTTAIAYRDNYCSKLCKSFGYETQIQDHKAYACNQYMFGSGGFGSLFYQYPLCIAYIHDGKQYTVSLYSETVNVGEIAKFYGGGGHKGAAGFNCTILPF